MRKVMLILVVLVLICSAASAAPALARPAEEQAPNSEPTLSEAMPAEEPAPAEVMPTEEPALKQYGQSTNEEESSATTPAAQALDAGVGVDPVRAPDDNADAPKDEQSNFSDSDENPDTSNEGGILIHCSPVTGCSKEDLGAPEDEQSSNFKEDPDAPKDEQSSSPEAGPMADTPVQPGAAGEGDILGAEEDDKGYDSSGIYGPWMKGYDEGDDKGYLADEQAANEEGDPQNGYSSNDIVGCPGDYSYDYSFDRCMPEIGTFGPAGAVNGISGIDSVGDATGDVIASPVYVAGDWLKGAGLGIWLGLDYYGGNNLVGWGEDIGGPLGWPLEGVGYTLSAVGDVAGYGVEGVGQVLDSAADGIADTVGDVVDLVGDAGGAVVDSLGDVVDDVGSWFGW